MSGHVFFKDRWYGFDDGLYAGARLLEILSRVADPTQTLESLPTRSPRPSCT
jgi:phosphomannomutase/phosphoglucomutase